MANLLRTAKSGSDWTRAELDAYNITIVPQTKTEFFGTNDFPDPTEPSLLGFMTNESRQTATDKKTKQLLHYLDLAMDPKMGQEAAVDNFAAELLRGLNYDDNDRIVFIRHALPFLICGENSIAQTDVCLMDDDEILLLLQEDKRLTSMKDPEPQIIAETIAAFATNNMRRERHLNLQPRDTIILQWSAPPQHSTRLLSLQHSAKLFRLGLIQKSKTVFFVIYPLSLAETAKVCAPF